MPWKRKMQLFEKNWSERKSVKSAVFQSRSKSIKIELRPVSFCDSLLYLTRPLPGGGGGSGSGCGRRGPPKPRAPAARPALDLDGPAKHVFGARHAARREVGPQGLEASRLARARPLPQRTRGRLDLKVPRSARGLVHRLPQYRWWCYYDQAVAPQYATRKLPLIGL